MMHRKHGLGLASLVLATGGASSVFATPISVPNGGFESPQVAVFGSADNWTSANGNGLCADSVYVPGATDPDGGGQCGYIVNGSYLATAAPIATLDPAATYTVNFSTSTGIGLFVTAELVDGSPTGAVLAHSLAYTSPSGQFTAQSAVLKPDGGTANDPLYLVFVASGQGYQLFIDGVSASSAVPEPASIGLLGLCGAGLLARRRKD